MSLTFDPSFQISSAVHSSPIIPYNTGTWDSGGLGNPVPIRDTINSRWAIYYNGYSNSDSTWRTGLATATAGPGGPYTVYSGNPIMSPNGSEGTLAGNGGFAIIGGTLYTIYVSTATNKKYLATSTDGVTFTRSGSNPLSPTGNDPWLWVDSNGLLHCLDTPFGGGLIYSSTSSDGVNWSAQTLIGQAAPTGYTSASGEGAICFDKWGGWHVFMDGQLNGVNGRQIQRMYSPDGGSTWTNLPAAVVPDGTSSWYTQGCFDSGPLYYGTAQGNTQEQIYLFFAGATNTNLTQPTDAGIGLAIATIKPGWI